MFAKGKGYGKGLMKGMMKGMNMGAAMMGKGGEKGGWDKGEGKGGWDTGGWADGKGGSDKGEGKGGWVDGKGGSDKGKGGWADGKGPDDFPATPSRGWEQQHPRSELWEQHEHCHRGRGWGHGGWGGWHRGWKGGKGWWGHGWGHAQDGWGKGGGWEGAGDYRPFHRWDGTDPDVTDGAQPSRCPWMRQFMGAGTTTSPWGQEADRPVAGPALFPQDRDRRNNHNDLHQAGRTIAKSVLQALSPPRSYPSPVGTTTTNPSPVGTTTTTQKSVEPFPGWDDDDGLYEDAPAPAAQNVPATSSCCAMETGERTTESAACNIMCSPEGPSGQELTEADRASIEHLRELSPTMPWCEVKDL